MDFQNSDWLCCLVALHQGSSLDHESLLPFFTGTARFVAARDIGHGEQLSISYIDATASLASRQQQLDWAYGFHCKCDLCVEEKQQ